MNFSSARLRVFSISYLVVSLLSSTSYAVIKEDDGHSNPLSTGKPVAKAPAQQNKVKIPESLKNAFTAGKDGVDSFIDIPANPENNTGKQEAPKNPSANNNSTSHPSPSSEPEQKDSGKSTPSFEKNIQDRTLQENSLKMMGIRINEDNLAARFLSEEDLYDRLVHNFHGHELNLQKMSFQNQPKNALILDALKQTKSVRRLNLADAHLTTQGYLALISVLAYNRSLEFLNLDQASWMPDALKLLGLALKDQKTLRELFLRPKNTIFTDAQVEEFYELIKDNKGLRLIVWPEDKKENTGLFSAIFSGGNGVLSKIEQITAKNAVAALHYGVMYKDGVVLSQDLQKAENFLKKAHDLGHPLAGYELAQIKEQNDPEEAFKWYLASAEKSFPAAQMKVSDYHRAIWPKGTMKDPDYKNAHLWCERAAKQEHPEALYRLGRFYEAGRFVEKSFELAAYNFYRAVEWGHPEAFTALGTLYLNPDYSGSKLETAKTTANYYLEWGKRFPEIKGTADKHLTYLKQDEGKK